MADQVERIGLLDEHRQLREPVPLPHRCDQLLDAGSGPVRAPDAVEAPVEEQLRETVAAILPECRIRYAF